MVESEISERWYIGSWALYKRLNLTQPTFLSRNIRQILDAHQRNHTISGTPQHRHLEQRYLSSFDSPFLKMPPRDRTTWQTPSHETLEDLFERKEPRLKIVLHELRLEGAASFSPRRKSFPFSPSWLPDHSETGRIPCVVDITIKASNVAESRLAEPPQFERPPPQPLKISQQATLVCRKDTSGHTRLVIDLKDQFYVKIDELPGHFMGRRRNGARKFGRDVFPEYEMELEIRCGDSDASATLLSIIDPGISPRERQNTPYWDSCLFTKWGNIVYCPQPRKTLAVIRKSQTKTGKPLSHNTKYQLDVDMDWSEWSESQSVLGTWNRDMNAFDPPRTQLPTPSASEHTDLSGLADRNSSMEPENRRIVYVFEPGNDSPPRTFTQEGFKCVFCKPKSPQVSWDQLHFHYLTYHDHFKFTIVDEDPRGTEKPAWKVVYIEVGDRPHGRPSNNDKDYRELNWIQPRRPFDLTAYLRGEGDPCWEPSGKAAKPITKGAGKRLRPGNSRQISERLQRPMPKLKEPELVGSLPSKKRKRFVVPAIKDANGNPVQLFRSISKRAIQPGEELSESDDDVDLAWLKTKQDSRQFPGLPKHMQNFIRLFDEYMELEHLCGDRFVGDALVRFVKAHAKEIGRCPGPCRDKINQLREDGIITKQTRTWCLDFIAGCGSPKGTAKLPDGHTNTPEDAVDVDRFDSGFVPDTDTGGGEKARKRPAPSNTPLISPTAKRRKYKPGGAGGGGHHIEIEEQENAQTTAPPNLSNKPGHGQNNPVANTMAAPPRAPVRAKPSSCVCGKDVESARGSILCANVHCIRTGFHLACVRLTRRIADWQCADCRAQGT